MIPAATALQRLTDGNARYVADEPDAAGRDHRKRRERTAREQHPFAAILACSDSRVPVETVFDQGIGDLFVVRIAGNVVGPSQAGSLEFAASVLGVRLIVVLGHSRCGAIEGVAAGLDDSDGEPSEYFEFFVDRIRPSIERVLAHGGHLGFEELVEKAARENIRRSVAILQEDSAIIRSLAENDGLRVVGAKYSLQTGEIVFL